MPGQVSTDDRPLLERLRRCQLWQIADKIGVPYPNGAPKTVMVDLLKSMGVDPTQHITFQPVYGRDESGQQTVEYYPEIADHATAGKAIDYDQVIAEKIKAKQPTKAEAEAENFARERMEALERRNSELEAKIDRLLGTLEADTPPETAQRPELPFKLTLGQKKQLLASRGVDPKGMTREEVDAALED